MHKFTIIETVVEYLQDNSELTTEERAEAMGVLALLNGLPEVATSIEEEYIFNKGN